MTESETAEGLYEDEVVEEDAKTRGPRWVRVLKRVGIALGVLVVLLVLLGVSLYEWGGMGGSADPRMQAKFDAMVAAGQAQPVQARLVIPIPGCTCHSTDPVQTAKHRTYRMSECNSCHATDPPSETPLQ